MIMIMIMMMIMIMIMIMLVINFNYPGKRPVSQSTKVDRLVLIGDQHTMNI